jgi:hypothetical protein
VDRFGMFLSNVPAHVVTPCSGGVGTVDDRTHEGPRTARSAGRCGSGRSRASGTTSYNAHVSWEV